MSPNADAERVPPVAYRTRVAFTGHRPELFADPSAAQHAVDTAARELSSGHFLVGGQRGVDTWAAGAAITLGVPFTLILPLPVESFVENWSTDDRRALDRTLAKAA